MEGGSVIDYITFNEELNAINDKLLHSKDPKVKLARLMIIGTMQKYEKKINDFEKEYAPKDDEPIDHEQRMKENMQIEGFINGMVKSVSA